MSQAPRCEHGRPERGVYCDKCHPSGCEHGAQSSAVCRVPGCGSYDEIEYEIEIMHTSIIDTIYWHRDGHVYHTKADAEWMARYLELVKGKGRTRVVEVKRKAV